MTDTTRDFIRALGRLLLEIAGEEQTATVDNPSTVAPNQEPQPAPAVVPQVVPAVVPMKGSPDKRKFKRPIREHVCIVCGRRFMASGPRPLICPNCSLLRQNKNPNFLAAYAEAKARLAAGEDPPLQVPAAPTRDDPSQVQPAIPEGKIRCERMHATISPEDCGGREYCEGCSFADR